MYSLNLSPMSENGFVEGLLQAAQEALGSPRALGLACQYFLSVNQEGKCWSRRGVGSGASLFDLNFFFSYVRGNNFLAQ